MNNDEYDMIFKESYLGFVGLLCGQQTAQRIKGSGGLDGLAEDSRQHVDLKDVTESQVALLGRIYGTATERGFYFGVLEGRKQGAKSQADKIRAIIGAE